MYNYSVSSICTQQDDAQWQSLGPKKYSEPYLGLISEVLATDFTDMNNILIAPEGSGIWKFEPNGNIWENKTNSLRLPALTITQLVRDPFNNQHIIASTGAGDINTPRYGIGIIESFDNGDSWQRVGQYMDQEMLPIIDLIIDQSDIIPSNGISLYAVVGYQFGEIHHITLTNGAINQPSTVTFSKDIDFIEDMSSRQFNDIEMSTLGHPPGAGPYYLYVSSFGLFGSPNAFIMRKEIGNSNWDNITPGSGPYKRARITTPNINGEIYALIDEYISQNGDIIRRIFKSTNFGTNWTEVCSPYTGGDCKDEIEVSPYTGKVYIGGIYFKILDETLGECVSIDHDNWKNTHMDVRDMYFLGDASIGSYENILIATDGNLSLLKVNLQDPIHGSIWTDLNGEYLPITQFGGLAISQTGPELILAGATHNNTYKGINGNWEKIYCGDGDDCAINPVDPSIYYGYCNDAIFRKQTTISEPEGEWFIGMNLELHPDDPYVLYTGRGKSNEYGANGQAVLNVYYDEAVYSGSWVKKYVPLGMKTVGAIAISNTTNNIFVADEDISITNAPCRLITLQNGTQYWDDLSQNLVYYDQTNTTLSEAMIYANISDIEINCDNPNEMWISCTGLKEDGNGNGRFRVLHSDNGGQSWEDYSLGLPLFPCNSIKYLPGSNGMVFVATDVGVFYTDNYEYTNNGGWQCFTDGLPLCVVTGLEIRTNCNMLYASTWGYGTWKTFIPFFNNGETTITQSEIWNSDRKILANVTINPGCTLTINNAAKIYMGCNNSITIKPGGKLVLEGNAEITTGCGCLWEGIIVEGNHNLSQIPETNQGVVEVLGGKISNARAAIATRGFIIMKPNYEGGGIVRLDDATIKNCITGVAILPYWNFIPNTTISIPNVSYIKNCDFITNDEIAAYGTPGTFIRLMYVEGVDILANNFINSSTISNPSQRGNGIIATEASFNVEPICTGTYSPCDSWAVNHFTGLNYGIRVQNISPNYAPTIHMAEFNNVYRGIFLSGVMNATVTLNTFDVPNYNDLYTEEYNDPYNDKESYGLYLDMCSGYTIEENEFIGPGWNQISYGVIVNNSFNESNEVYKNTFIQINNGILALNDNRSDNNNPEESGLLIKCNKTFYVTHCFSVRDSDDIDNDGIGAYQGADRQGDVNSPAGNTFSHICYNNGPNDYNDEDCSPFFYYHHQVSPTSDLWIPECYNNNEITLIPTSHDFSDIDVCKSNLDGNSSPGTPISLVYSDLLIAKQNKNSSNLIYNIWKDGGNTELLETEVELAMPPESYELYNNLIAESPYLSDDVLIAAIQNEEVLTSLMIKLIMIANPQSSRSDEVMDALYNRINPLPQTWIDEILAGSNYISQLEVLEVNVAYDYHKYKMIIDDLKTRLINDSINIWAKDSLINLLLQEDNLNLRYELAFLYLNNGNFTQMENVLNNIPLEFNLRDEQQDVYQYYVNYLDILKNMHEDSLSVNNLDSTLIETLQNISNLCQYYAAGWARNLLGYPNDDPRTWYREEIPDNNPSARLEAPLIKPNISKDVSYFKVYPNPAKDYFAIDYNVMGFSELKVNILDALGKLVFSKRLLKDINQELINISNINSGFYIINLIGDGKIIESKKLSVSN